MNRLLHKVAVVTGSSSGIGKAIALRFADEGARVVVAARRLPLCQDTVGQIRQRGGEAIAIQTDVSREQDVETMISRAVDQYGRIDLLVNNAGIIGGRAVADTSTDTFDEVIDTNLRGTFFCCRAGFRQMKRQGGGIILNMSSVSGLQAWAGTGTYSASKHGIMALTRALAEEGRPFNIRASAICPGGVAENLVDATTDEILLSGKINPYDVAETALYLATLGPNAVVHQIVVDRMGADW